MMMMKRKLEDSLRLSDNRRPLNLNLLGNILFLLKLFLQLDIEDDSCLSKLKVEVFIIPKAMISD